MKSLLPKLIIYQQHIFLPAEELLQKIFKLAISEDEKRFLLVVLAVNLAEGKRLDSYRETRGIFCMTEQRIREVYLRHGRIFRDIGDFLNIECNSPRDLFIAITWNDILAYATARLALPPLPCPTDLDSVLDFARLYWLSPGQKMNPLRWIVATTEVHSIYPFPGAAMQAPPETPI